MVHRMRLHEVSWSFASLFHLVLISADRFVAMKCSLRYDTVVTKFRITVAVACSWLAAVTCSVVNRVSPEIVQSIRLGHIMAASSLLVIIYCHGSVYFVSRRHLIQIKSVQPSQEVAAKFLNKKKFGKQPVLLSVEYLSVIFLGLFFYCYLIFYQLTRKC